MAVAPQDKPHTSEKAFRSWSGGKDSCLSLDYAQRTGFEVSVLFNMLTRRRGGPDPVKSTRYAEI